MAKRSSAYPSITLDSAVEIVAKIYSDYGDSLYVNREAISESLGVTAGTIQMKVSACVQYGLLELKSKEGYKPSQLFIKIHSPLDDQEQLESKIEAVHHPKLYNKLFSQFNARVLPKHTALANYLSRECGISPNASDSASDVFIRNVESLELLGDNNILRTGQSLINTKKEDKEIETEAVEKDVEEVVRDRIEYPIDKNQQPLTIDAPKIPNANNTETRSHEILLTNKKKCTLIIPVDINEKDLRIIKAQLTVIELAIGIENE